MKVAFRKSFERDLRRIKDRSTLDRVKQVVEQVEEASNLAEIRNVRKLYWYRWLFSYKNRGTPHWYITGCGRSGICPLLTPT